MPGQRRCGDHSWARDIELILGCIFRPIEANNCRSSSISKSSDHHRGPPGWKYRGPIGGLSMAPFFSFFSWIDVVERERYRREKYHTTFPTVAQEGGNQSGDPDPSKPALSTRLHRSPSRGCYSISRPALVEPPEPTPRAEEAQSKHRPRKCTTEIEDRYVLQKPTTHVSPTRASNGRNEFEART